MFIILTFSPRVPHFVAHFNIVMDVVGTHHRCHCKPEIRGFHKMYTLFLVSVTPTYYDFFFSFRSPLTKIVIFNIQLNTQGGITTFQYKMEKFKTTQVGAWIQMFCRAIHSYFHAFSKARAIQNAPATLFWNGLFQFILVASSNSVPQFASRLQGLVANFRAPHCKEHTAVTGSFIIMWVLFTAKAWTTIIVELRFHFIDLNIYGRGHEPTLYIYIYI